MVQRLIGSAGLNDKNWQFIIFVQSKPSIDAVMLHILDAYGRCTHDIFAVTLALRWKRSTLYESASLITKIHNLPSLILNLMTEALWSILMASGEVLLMFRKKPWFIVHSSIFKWNWMIPGCFRYYHRGFKGIYELLCKTCTLCIWNTDVV